MKKDETFIKRCIELAEKALDNGEATFGSLVVRNNKVIAESSSTTKRDNDVTNHAEILVMRKAQKLLNTSDLSECSIYSNCEPCAMCSFMIRELKFKKVVFASKSPLMGGFSRWKILQNKKLEALKPFFDKSPQVISGILEKEATKTFERQANLLSKNRTSL
ncbi:MAG: nucleoside deaminase [Candidatus Woykebacteria bacterium]